MQTLTDNELLIERRVLVAERRNENRPMAIALFDYAIAEIDREFARRARFSESDLAWFRKPLGALLVLGLVAMFAACHPVYPSPKSPDGATVALVQVNCSWGASAMTDHGPDVWAYDSRSAFGTAVLTSGTTAITAMHVIDCVSIPTIYLTANGERHRFVYSKALGGDIVELRTASAGPGFGDVLEPKFGHAWLGPAVIGTNHGLVFGDLAGNQVIADIRHGDSGSPILDSMGRVVGIITRSDNAGHGITESPWN